MTSRRALLTSPPQTKDVQFNIWAKDLVNKYNNYIQTLQVPVSTLGTGAILLHGKHPAVQIQATEKAYFSVIIPFSVSQFKEAGIRIIPTVTGTINYTVNFSYGSVGADENTSTKTESVTGLSVTDDEITEIDLPIGTFFTDLDTNDQLGIEIILDSATTTTDIYVLSFYLKYI